MKIGDIFVVVCILLMVFLFIFSRFCSFPERAEGAANEFLGVSVNELSLEMNRRSHSTTFKTK